MDSITRQPRLLVKTPSAPARLGIAVRNARIEVAIEPLFTSIRTEAGPGMAAPARWHLAQAATAGAEVNAWDLCHHLLTQGFGVAGAGPVEFAEPDLEQQWVFGSEARNAFALSGAGGQPAPPDSRLPTGDGVYWFRDAQHSQLEQARAEVGQPVDGRVLIAHLDTGYDPRHITRPQFLRTDLEKNFVDEQLPDDATDRSSGGFNNLGHGTGTLGILAGAAVDGVPLGGAAFLDVVPIRVANSVVLFSNSSIAKAFDYVHRLSSEGKTPVAVVTMSMGGLASQAWAEAVNALYDLGVFIVTAAGNNFGNLPTRNLVYPARFKRVVAACGVMADGRPYADLPLKIMAGSYGPDSKMVSALSGCTPNTPWARLGSRDIVDHNGCGTSAATPQVASAAALWIQKHQAQWSAYPQGWMRVEAVRKALFESASLASPDLRGHLGNGMIQAAAALARQPAAAGDLERQPEDVATFPFLRVITGLGMAAPDARHRMLELEVLQLTQRSHELEALLPEPDIDPKEVSAETQRRFVEALIAAPGASQALRDELKARGVGAGAAQGAVPASFRNIDARALDRAVNPPQPAPVARCLRVFAFDPLLGTQIETASLNETTLQVRWENDLMPGPAGEYLEVVDMDPSTGACYAPVDLNQPLPLSQSGLNPSEANPQFHQQMVYAVAMKTIEHFERALGRTALWSPRSVRTSSGWEDHYVRRLRIYPHAIREENSFYSPDKKALLFGYFPAGPAGLNLPGGTVFCCLSHDIVAHETTHALLDGLHRRFQEPTNPDVLAFHEAFADLVAMLQHFTVPEALRDQIARTQGDLARQNMLGELALQFGEATGRFGALRSAIGRTDEKGNWQPATPSVTDYQDATEPHDRGAVLVAAVFNAFLDIYRSRSADLIRLATGGTGVLPAGAIPHELVDRLAQEASKTAEQVLNICIRALDYCPPVDITFGEYFRALITADRDLVPDDDRGYRAAFIGAFRRRGIYPAFVRNLSVEGVCWDRPDVDLDLEDILHSMSLGWDLHANRRRAHDTSKRNAILFHDWLRHQMKEADSRALGFFLDEQAVRQLDGTPGRLSPFEVHSVRPVRRVGPDGQQQLDLVVEITQSWIPDGDTRKYRGGCTLIIDLESHSIRYCVRKRVGHPDRIAAQQSFQMAMDDASLRSNYFTGSVGGREPFAMLHRGA